MRKKNYDSFERCWKLVQLGPDSTPERSKAMELICQKCLLKLVKRKPISMDIYDTMSPVSSV